MVKKGLVNPIKIMDMYKHKLAKDNVKAVNSVVNYPTDMDEFILQNYMDKVVREKRAIGSELYYRNGQDIKYILDRVDNMLWYKRIYFNWKVRQNQGYICKDHIPTSDYAKTIYNCALESTIAAFKINYNGDKRK